MYYKITNRESDVYKKLYKLRQKENAISANNKKLLAEKIHYKWETYLGNTGQQNFNRTTQYFGFVFLNPENVDAKIWKRDKEKPDVFVPNTRTKSGKEMKQFLFNGMQGSNCNIPFRILGIERGKSFNFPFIEICDDGDIVIWLGDCHEPKDNIDIIEITSKEFNDKLNK